jgi:hypothetical protein
VSTHYCIGNPCRICFPQPEPIPTAVVSTCKGCHRPSMFWKSVGTTLLCADCWGLLEAHRFQPATNWADEERESLIAERDALKDEVERLRKLLDRHP